MKIRWRGPWEGWWRSESGEVRESSAARSLPVQQRMALLLITGDHALRESLIVLGVVRGWDVCWAVSDDEAIAILGRRPVPLVICDEEAPGDWRDIVRRIAFLPRSTCVLLASRFCDEALKREANRHFAYDVIAKPLNWEEVTNRVLFAWSWYTSGCASWWGPPGTTRALHSS